MSQLKCFIHTHFTQQLSLETLSEQLDMTPQYISLYFKKCFGITFVKYLTALRLDLVRKYLLYTNETVTHISSVSGFPNSISLNQAFKKEFGTTPLIYRKNNKPYAHSYPFLFSDNDRYGHDL